MNKKWFVLIGVVVSVITMLVGCAQPAPSPAPTPTPAPEKITLKFSTWMPAAKAHPNYVQAERMFAEITKRTNGQVQFQMFASEQLATQKDQIDGLKAGLFDICTHQAPTAPGKTPLWTIDWQPWAPTKDVYTMMQTMRRLSKHPAMMKELDNWGAMYLVNCITGPRTIMSKKELIKLDDFKGLKIRSSGREAAAYQIFGANPVSVATADMYDALSKGTIDATTLPYVNLVSYGINEVTKYFWDINVGMGSPIFIMSKNTYSKLPGDVQKIIMTVVEEDEKIHSKVNTDLTNEAMDKDKKAGKQIFNSCSPAEQKRYDDVVGDQIMGDWIKEMTDKGMPGREIFNAFSKIP